MGLILALSTIVYTSVTGTDGSTERARSSLLPFRHFLTSISVPLCIVSHIFVQRIKVSSVNGAIATIGLPVDVMRGMNANSPVPPFGGAEQYDICAAGILVSFTAELVERDMAWKTGWKMFTVKLNANNWENPNAPRLISNFTQARTQNPLFNPAGVWLSFLAMDRPGDESDRLHLVLYNVNTRQFVFPNTTSFDRSIAGYAWSQDGKQIIVDTDSNGNHALFSFAVDFQTGAVTVNPTPVVGTGSSSGQMSVDQGLGWYFLHHDMLSPPSIYFLSSGEPDTPFDLTRFVENPNLQQKFNLSIPQSITFQSGSRSVQAWFLAPYDFVPTVGKKWPLAVLIRTQLFHRTRNS